MGVPKPGCFKPGCLQIYAEAGLNFSSENEHFKLRMKLSSENSSFVRGGMFFLCVRARMIFFDRRASGKHKGSEKFPCTGYTETISKQSTGVSQSVRETSSERVLKMGEIADSRAWGNVFFLCFFFRARINFFELRTLWEVKAAGWQTSTDLCDWEFWRAFPPEKGKPCAFQRIF